MGYVGELPGMYYDQEKGKYFKIQATGAVPATSAYSSEDVKRRKRVDERAHIIEKEALRQKGRIKRLILGPLMDGILNREYGRGREILDGPRIFAKGLVPQGCCKDVPPFGAMFTVQPREYHGMTMLLDVQILYEAFLSKSVWPLNLERQHSIATEHLGHPGQSTSMSVHEGRQRLVATWFAASPNSGIAITHTLRAAPEVPGPNIILGPGRSRGSEVDVHSSTEAPESSPFLFAIGTSEGIMTIDKQNVDALFLSPKLFPNGHARDVFALKFLSNDPSVLMSGGRNGILNITDLRVPDFGTQADFIRHPSSITHIKQLDDHRILVAGLKSSLCQYDLRFRKTADRTQSILQYPEYYNKSTIRIGLDVDVETGVIAAAQEHDVNHSPLQLFSLHGGHTLDGQDFMDVRTRERDDIIPCVRFVRDDTDRLKSLYVAADVIRRYTWG